MKKLLGPILFLIVFLLAGCNHKASQNPPAQPDQPTACSQETKICPDKTVVQRSEPNCTFAACPTVDGLVYTNTQFGFTLILPSDWLFYSATTTSIEYGTKVKLRHPKWTEKQPYEDIPILVYPLAQWQKWEADNFSDYPTAAPIGPRERGRNNLYVFATAPRYNYDYQTGWEEVEKIIQTLVANPVETAGSNALTVKTGADPKNCSYSVDGKNVTLKDGSAVENIAGSNSKINTQYFGNEIANDFNGDGLSDTAFLLTQNSGGSGTFYYLAVAFGAKSGCQGSKAVLLGDRIAPQTTEYQSGKIIVNYAVRKASEPMTAKPFVGVTKYFVVDSSGKLVETARLDF